MRLSKNKSKLTRGAIEKRCAPYLSPQCIHTAKEIKLETEPEFHPFYRRNFLVVLELKFKRIYILFPNVFMFVPK